MHNGKKRLEPAGLTHELIGLSKTFPGKGVTSAPLPLNRPFLRESLFWLLFFILCRRADTKPNSQKD